jgi:hypothetical protein
MSTAVNERPNLRLALHQEPRKPPYLAHLIPEEEKEGILIDCSMSECMNSALYWVSCGGLKQSLCAGCEALAHAEWKHRS